MKRTEMVSRLIKEGLSSKTLATLTDNQLKSLCDRMVNEQTQVMMTKLDITKPDQKAKLQGMLKDPVKNAEVLKRTTFEEDVKEEKKKPTQKQLSTLDKNKNKKIDKQDFELLRKGKTSKKSEVKEESEYEKFFFNDKKEWDKERNKLDVSDDDDNWSRDENGKLIAKWINEPNKSHINYRYDEDYGYGWVIKQKSNKSEVKEKKEKWIKKAIHPSKEGSLKKALGVKKDEKIPETKLKAAAKKGGKIGQRARLAMTLRKLKENQEVSEWINNLAETNYHPFTSKGEIMELLQRKLNETETMTPMPQKAKKGHNGIPEFMTYDSIMGSTKEKETETPVITPSTPTKPKINPYDPGTGTDPKPKALAEKKKK